METIELIKGATVVTDGSKAQLDVRIDGNHIVEIGSNLTADKDKVFDATGLYLLPGLIDDQVHFREPGSTHKAEIATESAAAVAGGITSYLEMPNTNPATTNEKELANKLEIASKNSAANYGFYLGATGQNFDDIASAVDTDACGIKVFFGASTGDLLVYESELIEEVFKALPNNMLLAAHCEDHLRVQQRTQQFIEQYGQDLAMDYHPQIRDVTACYDSTKKAIELAHKYQKHLHVLHLTTAKEIELLRQPGIKKDLVTAEACVHHLLFCNEDYASLKGRIKCNPAIKTKHDRDTIRSALVDNTIDILATDHAPHLLKEKEGDYQNVAAGLPLVEHSLLVMLELVANKIIDLERLVQLAAHNPAKLFNIDKRGHIQQNYFADLVLVDLQQTTTPTDGNVKSKCGWTPFYNHTFPAKITAVWVSGRMAYAEGKVMAGTGMQLGFNR